MSNSNNSTQSADWNERLRKAVHSEDVPPFLEARIRNTILSEGAAHRWSPRNFALAASALLLAGIVIGYPYEQAWIAQRSQDSYVAAVSAKISPLMRIGLMDHIRCAVFRKYAKNPPSTEEFVKELGPQYAGLIPIVRSHVPATYKMTLAHQCTFEGRDYIHLSLKDDSHTMSLVISRKRDGEALPAAGLLPDLAQSGIPMYRTGVDHYQAAAFETRDYLVYFISDLSAEENTDMMQAMSPQVKAFLEKLES